MTSTTINFGSYGVDRVALERWERQARYMAAARRREVDRRHKRVARLEEAQEGLQAAISATRSIAEGSANAEFLLRQPFVSRDSPRTIADPDEPAFADLKENLDERPPMTQLIHRRTRALPFYLLAVWERQAGAAPWEPRPRLHFSRGWDTLLGDQRLDKRNRNLRSQRVVEALHRRRLVEMGPSRTPGRYDEFTLLSDDQSGDPYSVPPSDEPVLSVPSAFITNGWHLVLEPPEIACLLMLLDLARTHPTAHSVEGVGIVDRLRRSLYGVTPEVYEVHNELTEFGLVELVDSVAGRRRGRVAPSTKEADLVTYQFKVNLDALHQEAYDVVHAHLRTPGAGRISDTGNL